MLFHLLGLGANLTMARDAATSVLEPMKVETFFNFLNFQLFLPILHSSANVKSKSNRSTLH